MHVLVATVFAIVVYLPCALLLGGLIDLVWERYVLQPPPRKRSRSAWFNMP